MKLTLIGGGSTYTPELVDGLLKEEHSLPVSEICLMDVDERRLDTVAAFARRMLQAHSSSIRLTSTLDLVEALEGAKFVNNLIRVGGQQARILDERIPLRHEVVGQETTGPGGLMKALRTLPVVLQLADAMDRHCPEAWLINYTNPAGIVAEALHLTGRERWMSLCGGPVSWMDDIASLTGNRSSDLDISWVGLNHLGFATSIRKGGTDITTDVVNQLADSWAIDPELMRTLGVIPAEYLKYYYHRDRFVADHTGTDSTVRAEDVARIEHRLLEMYADDSLCERPQLLSDRGGRGYSIVALAAMEAIHHDTGALQIVLTANQGAIHGIPNDASVEILSAVSAAGVEPIAFGEIPTQIRGLIQSVKAYESLAVRAALEESSVIAMQAMMSHPLVPSWDVGLALWNDLAKANQTWLPWLN